MTWPVLILFLFVPVYANLSDVLEDKATLTARCDIMLDRNASQVEIDKLDSELNLSGEDGLRLLGYCMGLKIDQGLQNITNRTFPLF